MVSIALLFNLLLLVFFGVCLIDVSGIQELPGSDIMGAAIWPQMILGLLVVMLCINIFNIIKTNRNIIKTNKADSDKTAFVNAAMVKNFFKSKLFIGIALVAAMSFLLEPLGFVVTVFLFMFAYCRLLGRRGAVRLAAISLAVTLILFFLFSRGLSVMLPRGYGIIRDFSLMLESI